jgi:hypothetical protein
MTANERAQRGVRRASVKENNMKSTMNNFPGEIAGIGITSTGEFHAYQARPAQQEDPNHQRQGSFIQ